MIETHVYADHITGAGLLRERLGAQTLESKAAGAPCAGRSVVGGDVVRIGRHEIEVSAPPGHTDGCVTDVVHDAPQTIAFGAPLASTHPRF